MAVRVSPTLGWSAAGIVGCFTAAGVALTLAVQAQAAPPTVIRERVTLAGMPVAGKTPEEAKKFTSELAARLLRIPLRVRYQERTETTTPAQLGARYDVEGSVSALADASQDLGGWMDRVKAVFVGPPAVDVPLTLKLKPDDIRRALASFSVKIGAEPRNPRYTKVGGKFKITAPRPGKELDPEDLLRQVREVVEDATRLAQVAASLGETSDRGTWVKAQKSLELKAVLRTAHPRIALKDLKEITAGLASFSTHLAGSSNRVHNIRLAARAIDGAVLLPGDVFSYNEIVGPRVPSAGYREAPVIIEGQLQSGTGGGICQVSSTLYNAALLADMEIVKRSHHAFPVHYVPAGRDATVVDGVIDFQFRNRFKHPIAVDAKVRDGRVWFHIYGHPDDRCQVELARSGVYHNRSGGVSVSLRRIVKREGGVLRRELVSSDSYRPPGGSGGRASNRRSGSGSGVRLASSRRRSPTRTFRRRRSGGAAPAAAPAAPAIPAGGTGGDSPGTDGG